MSDRRPSLTERAQKVLQLAGAVAEQFGHGSIAPLHLAVGVVREGSGVASTAMRFHGIAPRDIEPHLMRELASLPAADRSSSSPGLDAQSEALFGAAVLEAAGLQHAHVGTEHLLLALLHDSDSTIARIFAGRGLGYRDARARIEWIVATDPLNPAPFVPPPDAAPGAP